MKKTRSPQGVTNAPRQPKSSTPRPFNNRLTKYARKAFRGSSRMMFTPWTRISLFARVVWILAVMSLLFLVAGYLIASRQGLLAGFTLLLIVNSLVLLYSARVAELFPAQEWTGRDGFGLVHEVSQVAAHFGIKPPQVMVVGISSPLIYSTGLFPSTSRLIISEWLLTKLTPGERRALLVYEIYRQQRQLTSAVTAAAALSSCFQFLGAVLDYTIFLPVTLLSRNRQELGRHEPIRLGLAAMAPVIGFINRAAISRRKIFHLDMEVVRHLARLFSNTQEARHDLASALFKLDAFAKVRPVHIRLCDTPLFIVNPLTEFDVSSYFLVHPPLELRIKQLMGRPAI